MKEYDITFIGHMCFDEISPYNGETIVAPGSAVLCGAMAAARVGKSVAAVVKMDERDESIVSSMKEAGIDVYVVPSAETTYMKVIHSSPDVDERTLIQTKNAGFFCIEDIPCLQTKSVHLAGISDREFTLDFIRALKNKYYCISADMQSFVRQVDIKTKEISFSDVNNKKEIVSMLDMVKLDIVEAKVLTGLDNIEEAAAEIERWGCREIVITQLEGVLAKVNSNTYYEKFTNRSLIGRTGRGDTTFAGYLSWRMEHTPDEALKFAAALVSIKMESTGPFKGTKEDVLKRLKLFY